MKTLPGLLRQLDPYGELAARSMPHRFNYIASAADHRGHLTGQWSAPTVKGAMALADTHAHPSNRVSVNAAYTSDGTFWGEGRGRVMAQRKSRRWLVESYHDKQTETVENHGDSWRRRNVAGDKKRRSRRVTPRRRSPRS